MSDTNVPPIPAGVALLETAHELQLAETMLANRVRAQLGLRAADYQALQLIAAQERTATPARPRDLMVALGVTGPAASIVAERLVQRDLVHRTQDPDDRRARTLTLTDGARVALVEAFGSFPDDMQDVLNKVPDTELAAIRELAGEIRDVLDRTAR